MLELREILDRTASNGAEEMILATLVDVQGSGYRLAGARMLIDRNGKSIGTVSGGCLEADILERAKRVLRTGQPTVVSYDTTKDDNSVFGLRMGCRGVVRVLLERANENETLGFIRECFDRRQQGSITTLISKTESVDIALASRYFSRSDTPMIAARSGAELNGLFSPVSRGAAVAMKDGRSRCEIYQTNAGNAEFFHEVIDPPTAILIFGAGYDAVPLARLAAQLGWRIAVIDRRPAWTTADRFPDADEIVVSRAESLGDEYFEDINSVAVVMNHNYDSDRAILGRLLHSSCRYIGVLGPKQRTEQLLQDLRQQGIEITKALLNKLYAPVGLDIGASTPEGIALSIGAEIQAVLAGRKGGPLKDREGPIYDR